MGGRDTEEKLVPQTRNETASAIAAGEAIEKHRGAPKHVEGFLHGLAYVVLKDKDGAEQVVYIDRQLKNPTFRKGVVAFMDAPSFIEYFKAHSTEESAIYATLDPARFMAVLDEHPANQVGPPSWRDFRATFTPALSKEWLLWTSRNGPQKAFDSTEEFAYFIEDNAPDFVRPEAAELMDVALNFRASQSVSYKAAQRLQDGHVELQYANIVNGAASGSSGSVKIPETFEIEIPLFAGPTAPPYKVEARLRYRIVAGAVKLWYDLVHPHKVLETAFNDLYTEVSDGTDRDVLLGTTD